MLIYQPDTIHRYNQFLGYYSFIHLFIHLFIYLFIYSFIHSVIQSFSHAFIQSFSHSVIYTFSHSVIHHLVIQSFYLSTHSVSHLFLYCISLTIVQIFICVFYQKYKFRNAIFINARSLLQSAKVTSLFVNNLKESDCKRNFNITSKHKWPCPIYYCTLETFI